MSNDTALAYGEAFAQFYDRRFSDYAEKAAPVLLKYFSSLPTSRTHPHVLDLGCGTGQLALRFLEAGYSFLGLDYSPHMLLLAERRCWNYVASHKARFLEADMSRFHLGGPFGMVVSTYNSINHLERDEKLKSCLSSVLSSLAPEGTFLFDFHTERGLEEWVKPESAEWEEGKVAISGSYDPEKGSAVMRIKGSWGGRDFEETVTNRTLSLNRLAGFVKEAGFGQVVFVGMEDLNRPLKDPEQEPRVVVLAR
jgi:SAM-dependent methyltransferase